MKLNLTISRRIQILNVAAIVALLVVSVLGLNFMKREMMSEKKVMTRNLVEMATNTLKGFHEKAEAGEMTEAEARTRALQAIREMRYEGANYVWINDQEARMVMHPASPQLEGQGLWDAKDAAGKYYFRAFVNTARQGDGGYVDYQWKRTEGKPAEPKLSYVTYFAPWGYVVGTGVYITDVNETFQARAFEMGRYILILIVVFLAAGTSIGRTIAKPVQAMTGAMERLAKDDLEVEVPAQGRSDEIGQMAEAVQVFKDNAIRTKQLEAEQEEQKKKAEEEKRRMMQKLADDFESSVGGIVETVSSAAEELQATAQSMSSISEETSTQASNVAAATEQASTNVQTVSSSAEELSSSIKEISRQVSEAASIAQDAAEKVEATNTQVAGLSSSAEKIGEVVQLIEDIAEQTNLLALNATIESARAGEAGKGFAVVANEVKNLAMQTSKATEQISTQIKSVQEETRSSVQAIEQIGAVVEQVNEISASIASAVEQQDAATGEIARNVEEAARGTGEVTSNIQGVTEAAGEAGSASTQVLSSAEQLAQNAGSLKSEMDAFLEKVRAG